MRECPIFTLSQNGYGASEVPFLARPATATRPRTLTPLLSRPRVEHPCWQPPTPTDPPRIAAATTHPHRQTEKAGSTRRASQAVPHPSTDRALQRLTSEFERDPVYSLRYGRRRTPTRTRTRTANHPTQNSNHPMRRRNPHFAFYMRISCPATGIPVEKTNKTPPPGTGHLNRTLEW